MPKSLLANAAWLVRHNRSLDTLHVAPSRCSGIPQVDLLLLPGGDSQPSYALWRLANGGRLLRLERLVPT